MPPPPMIATAQDAGGSGHDGCARNDASHERRGARDQVEQVIDARM